MPSTIRTAVCVAAAGLLLMLPGLSRAAHAQNNSVRITVKEIIEKLELDGKHAEQLVATLKNYNERTKLLLEATEGLAPEAKQSRRQDLEREFYEELSRVLTTEQIKKYKKLVDKPEATEDGTGRGVTDLSIIHPKYIELSKIPQLQNIRRALTGIELSGLQNQAVGQLFSEIAAKIEQLKFLGLNTDIFNDPSFRKELDRKLVWILTPTQYDEMKIFIESMPSTAPGTSSSQP